MKILLNLLPEENKDQVQRKLRLRFFLWQLFLALGLEIFYVSILVSVYFILDAQLQSLEIIGKQYDTTHTEQQVLDVYQKKFKATNGAVDRVRVIDRNHFSFTQIFVLLDAIVPEGVVIDHLTTKDYTVLLAGQAATRDDLLLFDARLKEAACAENVNVPISNLFSQEHVDFQIDFGIRKECLKNNTL